MEDILPLLIFTFSLTMGSLTIVEPLLTLSNQNKNNSLISLAVPAFLFLFLPFTFISATVLLIFHVAIPQSAYVKYLTMATRLLTFGTLLLGAALIVMFTLTAVVVPDIIKDAIVVMALVTAQVTIVRFSFNSINCLTAGFAPVLFGLCSSTAMLFLVDRSQYMSYHERINLLSSILIHLLLSCSFPLAILVLFIRASAASHGPPRLMSVVMSERLVKMTVALSFTLVMIGVYIMVGIKGSSV